MSKRLKLSVPALSLAALACMDAYAGCIGSPPFCSAGFNRSGSPAGDIIAERFAFPEATNAACPAIFTVDGGEGGGDGGGDGGLGILQGGVVISQSTPVSMTLAGTRRRFEGQNCGLRDGEDRSCDVLISVDCTNRIVRTRVQGPFEASAPGFNQVNNGFGPAVANFTFKLAPGVGDDICAAKGAGQYRDFSLRKAFFEACVGDDCIREHCTAEEREVVKRDELVPWQCRPIRKDDCHD